MSENYTTIKLPVEFIKLIDSLLDNKTLGFSSRTEVVKTAVREYYEKMREKKLI
jgi:Arc/MetJ-type ribon-helix-helix transcriptional regulator